MATPLPLETADDHDKGLRMSAVRASGMQITTMSPTSIKARDRLLAEPMNSLASINKSIDKNENLLL